MLKGSAHFGAKCRQGPVAALLDMNFSPDPVSKYAQKVRPCIFNGMVAGRASSSVTGVNTESTVSFPLSHMLVWCFPLPL